MPFRHDAMHSVFPEISRKRKDRERVDFPVPRPNMLINLETPRLPA